MKNKYIFPATFTYEEDGISVSFRDLQGCFSYGYSEQEAYENAKEALELHLYGMEEDNMLIPEASNFKSIEKSENEATFLIDVWMIPVRDQMKNRAVKKTLTIPSWLNDIAEEKKVNFSSILQSALKNYLGITP